MNNKIVQENTEKILFFDIETVSAQQTIKPGTKVFERFAWLIRDTKTGYIPAANEVISEYQKIAALKPQFNKIVVISVGFIKGYTLYIKAFYGEQKEIIEQFYEMVSKYNFKVAGHNIIGFDLPTVRINALKEKINPDLIPKTINDSGIKPWDLDKNVLDTMTILKGTNYNNISLDDLCMILGIESSKDDINGAQVTKAYYNGEIDRIVSYCNKDVVAIAKGFCALQGKYDLIQNVVDKTDVVEEKKTVSLLDHIGSKGDISMREAELLVDFVKSNSLDINHVVDTVKAAVSQSTDKPDEHSVVQYIKDELRGKVDMTGLEDVLEKGNLTKKIADRIIKDNADVKKKDNKALVANLEKFLIDKDKMKQKTASEAFKFVKSKLL